MSENLFDQSSGDFSSDPSLDQSSSFLADSGDQQISGPGPLLPSNTLSQPSLYTDNKGKPLSGNPKARASAAGHLIQNRLPEPRNFEEMVQQNEAILRSNPLVRSGATSQGAYRESTVRRYDDQDYGFIPGIDNDDFYGKRESVYETAGKGLLRLPTYIVTKTLEGAGFVAGMLNPMNWGSEEGIVSKAADNALYKAMDSFDDWTKNEWMPTFQEAADREKGFFNRMFTDGDFWAEDAVDGAAFMVSAFIPGMVLGKLGLGARAMSALGATRLGANALGTSVEGAEAIANYFTKAQKAAKAIDQFSTWAIATTSEAMFEAKEVRDKVRESLRDTQKPDGSYYTTDEVNKIAGDASRNTFLSNALLLGATNVFQMKYFFKPSMTGGVSATGGLGAQAALAPTESALKYYGKIIGGGIGREGFIEENLQLAIQRVNERYGTEGKLSSVFDLNLYRDILDQYTTQTQAAVRGDDTEASTSIGLGGLLGGGSNLALSRGERADKKLSAETALNAYTTAQQNWLKFGNIYKTEEVKTKDANGNEIVKNRVVLDPNNQPIVDQDKLTAVLTGLQNTSNMLIDADNSSNKSVRDYLRLSAFSEFVQAHINAGLEGVLIEKLDGLKKATPEDLAKLGFAAGEDAQSDIDRHKSIASKIIRQNKILNESILFDDSKEDRARKAALTDLAARQVITKEQLAIIDRENTETKDQLLTSEITSLSDGMVDQLNELLYRMEANKQTIEYLKKSGREKISSMDIYEKLQAELEQSLKNLEQNNPESIKALKKDADGYYLYEKDERNDLLTRQFLDRNLQRRAQVLNTVKLQGLEWAQYADNKNGKTKYMTSFNNEVAYVNEQKKKQEEEEKKIKEAEEAAKKKLEEEAAGQTPSSTPGTSDQKQPGEEKDNDDDDLQDFLDGAAQTGQDPVAGIPGGQNVPTLDDFLREKYQDVRNKQPDFKLDYDIWLASGTANFFINEYNRRYGANEKLIKPGQSQRKELDDQGKQELIDSLSLADTTRSTFIKASKAVQNVLNKLMGDQVFIDKLLEKIEQVKDEFARISLRALITGKKETIDSEYISLAEANVYVNNEEHIGFDMVNLNKDELQTGFVLKGDEALLQSLASNLSGINDRIVVKATRRYVKETQKQVADANIPNRTTLSYETPKDIVKLKKGQSIIASASRSEGFGTQIFTKDSANQNNIYIAGIENYVIVHPDNTTEPVTFSEEQRQFVKANMLVDGQQMTDEAFDRLQKIYNKVQEFNQEVELVLGENEEMDITPIFNQFFTVTKSGRVAEQGDKFEDLIKANPESLFQVMYQTESGEVLQKSVPLVVSRYGTGWVLDYVLNSDETLVYLDEASGEVLPVTNLSEYSKTVHGIDPVFTDAFKGGVYAWVARVPSDPKGYKPYMLKKDKGSEPVEYFKNFANEFRELKQVLEQGAATKEYRYKGQTFPTVNKLMQYFNMNVYGFYRAGQWNVNLSYNPKTKKFAFELRPTDKQKRNALTEPQKQALNLYFSDADIVGVTDSTADEQVVASYNKWVSTLIKDLIQLGEKLAKSDDPVQKELRSMLDSKALFFYETENDQKTYFLKLQDKSDKSFTPVSFLRYAASNMNGQVTVALNEEPVAPVKKKVKTKPSGLVSLGSLNDSDVAGGQVTPPAGTKQPAQKPPTKKRIIKIIEDDAPFMLRTEEQYERYTEQTYNEEIQWLAKALKNSGIALRDLGSILDNLTANRQVLGYYKDRAIYVDRALSAVGSIYHEAFHGLFRDLMTGDQRAFYLAKAKAKMGKPTQAQINEFRNDRNYYSKTNEEIVDLMAEELLAEGFRKYKLEQKEPKESWFKKFVKIIERIIKFFDRNQRAIDELYSNFDQGVYANRVAQPSNTISDEGVYALAYGRPKLIEGVDDETGEVGFSVLPNVPMNMEVQNELISKLTYRVANMKEGSFASKFERAVEELKSDYDLDALIDRSDPALADAIRNRYENKFNEASFALGVSVKYVLDDALVNDPDANEQFTDEGANLKTLEFIKKEVKSKIDTLGLEAGFASDDLEVPQDEEDQVETEKGGEFDKVHINPLMGLSKEFRSLFGIIPYQYTDPVLGITLNRVADGNMLFNAMIKVASDKPLDQILPALSKAVNMMQEDNDPNYAPLKAFADFIQSQFGIADLSDPTSKPTRNLFLYKQFIDTFFVTELPSYVIKATTTGNSTKAEVFDASINQDIKQKREAIKFYYEQAYRRLSTPEAVAEFNDKFKKLQQYINVSMFAYLKGSGINNRTSLNKVVTELKTLMDDVNIVLPKGLIRQSLLGIYSLENNNTFNPNSKQNIADIQNDQALMKEGSYLQGDFFNALAQIKQSNYQHVFADTKDKTIDLGGDTNRIDMLNKILKKSIKYIIKYDINSAISVFQNAENKNIYRYTRYTPPILLAQLVREKGMAAINDMYPILAEWMKDNKLFDGSLENELFLKNLKMSSFGGIRQEVGDESRNGVTFGSIDPKAYHLSAIVHFMNREKISVKQKNEKGKTEGVDIVTFKRSRTQEEATTTNFLVTGKYTRFVDGDNVNDRFVQDLMGFMRQEYNRIQREWNNKDNEDTLRYKDYNNSEKGRAFQFRNFIHFFDQHKSPFADNNNLRQQIKDQLLDAAKNDVPFEQAISGPTTSLLAEQLKFYMSETFGVYKAKLQELGVVKEGRSGQLESSLIPGTITQDFTADKIEQYGYQSLDELLLDFHLNIEMNKRMVNQIFDGDIAIGIKSVADYYKRNKSGVISGNSMKTGYFRTAVVKNITAFIPTKINPITEKEDFDLTAFASDENLPGSMEVDIADGQSYHTMNHRIRMMDAWGRVDSTVKQILHKAKYKKLTKDEIQDLEERKVVLNTIKTATGGILEYYKLSEHLINRTDVSRLVVPNGMTKDEAESELDRLYTEIETLEDLIIEDPNMAKEKVEDETNPEVKRTIEQKLEDLYAEVHSYWEPRRGREKLHHLLNSMESDGIDQLFDPNASKKTTLAPVTLEKNQKTNLKSSKSFTSSMFKFMQVETSGVKEKITLPTQARQLLTTYLTKLDSDIVYRNKSLKDLAQEYSETLGEITESATTMLDKVLLDEKGELNISQLFKTMHNGLKKQGADSNTLKYFAIDEKTGKPVHNPNLPAIKKIFTYYYFSLFNDSIFSQKVSGRSDILVSEYGYEVLYDTQDNGRIITQMEQDLNPDLYRDTDRFKTRHLGISVEKVAGRNVYSVEVMIPQHLAENESEKELYLTKLTKFFSTRIPTEDKRSMIVAKVVDYLDPSYRNSIVVPQLVHILAGSDLDVDKLYSHTFEHYIDVSGTAHVFGDYSKYATESQGRFAEYIQYMAYHPSFRDLVQAELEKVAAKPVFTPDFLKIAEQLGLSIVGMSAEELKQQRDDLLANIDILDKARRDRQAEHDMTFAAFISAAKTDRNQARSVWAAKRAEYLMSKETLIAAQQEVADIKAELKKMDNTLRMAALVNVLKTKKMPVTQAELTSYLNYNATPVLPVLNNQSLQQKIDILSNEKVFNDFYVNERSTVDPFKEVAKSIGASVDTVVTQNSIFSVMGDAIANELNSSSKDGIGIAASFNKFLAFAEKTGVSLMTPLIRDIDSQGNQNEHLDFSNKDSIRRTGQTLGMFADAAKEPIPSVLNLNPQTSGVSNVIVGMTGNLQLGLLINKIPIIEKITQEYIADQSAVQGADDRAGKSLRSMIQAAYKGIIGELEKQQRLSELFLKDDTGEISNNPIPIYIKTVDPQVSFTGLRAAEMDPKDITLANLGIEMFYEDGSMVVEDVAQAYLLMTYADIMTLNSDILKLGKILNLIKNQEPDFDNLDTILANYDYFMSGTSLFGESIVQALSSSQEYINLIKAAAKMNDYSRQILMERSPLFQSVRSILTSGMSNTFGNKKAKQDITDQIGKFVIINKIKADIKEKIEVLKTKDDKNSQDELAMLQESAKYFTADFWLDNNTLVDDLDYLATTNPGNPFVEFLKVNTRQDIDFLEATSRMKLDKDITENIINGYEALQKSKDGRTMRLSRQLFFYLLAKDGLGYGAFTFIKYLNPDLRQMEDVSKSLSTFQNLLQSQEKFVNDKKKLIAAIMQSGKKEEDKRKMVNEIGEEIFENYNRLFDDFFNNKTKRGQLDWINGIVNKIFSFAGNQKYIRKTYPIAMETRELKNAMVEVINAGVFSHIEPVTGISDTKFDFIKKAPETFTIDFNRIKDSKNEYIDTLLKSFSPYRDFLSGDLKMTFRVLLADEAGNLYKLSKLDDVPMSRRIAAYSVGIGEDLMTQGLKAEYVKLEVEGTNNLLNFGFNKADGMRLFETTRAASEEKGAARTMLSPEVLSQLSDNKTKDEAPSNYKDILGPVQATEDQIVDDDAEVARMLASGELKGVKSKSKGSEQLSGEIGFRTIGQAPAPVATETPRTTEITYTPIGKTEQTYKIVGTQVFNKEGKEVFKEESKDRNRIFANLAVKEGRAVVVEHKDNKYVVNRRDDIISVKTGDRMQWGPENGDRKTILEAAKKKFDAKASVQGVQVITNKSGRQVTPDNIQTLGPNEIFVFGSNTEGRHGLGTAKLANSKFGAKYFQPEGLQGQSYAIVTKNLKAGTQFKGETFNETGKRSVPIRVIGKGIQDMIVFAKNNPQLKFFVTKLGSRLAGYSEEEIRNLFERLKKYIPDNVILPAEYEVRDSDLAADNTAITLQDIDQLYKTKTRTVPLEQYRKEAKEFIETMLAAGMTDSAILEQLQCL